MCDVCKVGEPLIECEDRRGNEIMMCYECYKEFLKEKKEND